MVISGRVLLQIGLKVKFDFYFAMMFGVLVTFLTKMLSWYYKNIN